MTCPRSPARTSQVPQWEGSWYSHHGGDTHPRLLACVILQAGSESSGDCQPRFSMDWRKPLKGIVNFICFIYFFKNW